MKKNHVGSGIRDKVKAYEKEAQSRQSPSVTPGPSNCFHTTKPKKIGVLDRSPLSTQENEEGLSFSSNSHQEKHFPAKKHFPESGRLRQSGVGEESAPGEIFGGKQVWPRKDGAGKSRGGGETSSHLPERGKPASKKMGPQAMPESETPGLAAAPSPPILGNLTEPFTFGSLGLSGDEEIGKGNYAVRGRKKNEKHMVTSSALAQTTKLHPGKREQGYRAIPLMMGS